jgi:hypothetical protein
MLFAMFYCYAQWCYDAIMNVIVISEVFFVLMLCDIMLNGVILNAIMLGVVFCVYSVCRYAECRIFVVVLVALSSVSFILSIVMLNVNFTIVLSGVMLNAAMPSVVAPLIPYL